MKAREAHCYQLNMLIGQKVFAARKLYSVSRGFYNYNILYIKQESALRKKQTRNSGHKNTAYNLNIYAYKERKLF
jgi:hypothetical protein